jgi:hypothetical protein
MGEIKRIYRYNFIALKMERVNTFETPAISTRLHGRLLEDSHLKISIALTLIFRRETEID